MSVDENDLVVTKRVFRSKPSRKGKRIIHITHSEQKIDVHLEFSAGGRNCMVIIGGQLVGEFDPRGM